jgi:hypothetical protein
VPAFSLDDATHGAPKLKEEKSLTTFIKVQVGKGASGKLALLALDTTSAPPPQCAEGALQKLRTALAKMAFCFFGLYS